jgi:hypothetical protein
MRKTVYCFLFIAGIMLTACKDQMAEIKDFKADLQGVLWQKVLDQVGMDQEDSAAVQPTLPLNYLLREGFASKFGL